jgi:hypothetical protein
MSGRQSSNKQNGGRGAPINGRAPNNGRGNGQPRPQSTPTNTPRSSNGHQPTANVPALVNDLLGRTPNSTTSSSAQIPRVTPTNGNPIAPSEQARQEAETAIKICGRIKSSSRNSA